MTTYYLIDGQRISLREYRRMMPNVFAFLPIAVLKFLLPLGNNALVPLIDRLHELEWDELPDEASEALAAPVAGWERLGFRRVCVMRLPNPQKNRYLAAVLLLAPDRLSHAHVTYVRRPDGAFQWTPVYSLFRDGTLGMTTTQKHELDDPPGVLRSQQPAGLAPDELWQRHRDNLAGPWAEFEIEPLEPAGVRTTALEVERREVEFHLARGVLVPASDADYDRLADPDD
ncbi:hypothetical protein J0H58_05335 [bacterium]|nr:hypothetical protein [bacterium]